MAAPEGPMEVAPISVERSLRGVPTSEIPGKAADLVSHASEGDRSAVARKLVLETSLDHPMITRVVVGAIARVSPTAAGSAAGAAAFAQPRDLGVFARAAAAAAPGEAVGIVSALSKQRPENFDVAAIAVAKAAPGQDEKILQTLAVSVPSLKLALDRAYADVSKNRKKISVQDVVRKAKSYAVWDAGRNEFADSDGIYRNSALMGSSVSSDVALAGSGSSVASSGGVSAGASVSPGVSPVPQPPHNGNITYYFFGGKITPGASHPAPVGPRDYSTP